MIDKSFWEQVRKSWSVEVKVPPPPPPPIELEGGAESLEEYLSRMDELADI